MAREAPYDDFIMDHIKNARNYRVLDDANRKAAGYNPLCGDGLTVQLRVERGRIQDLGFQCECCGISMASASMMTECVKGRHAADVQPFIRAVIALLTACPEPESSRVDPVQRALLATVRQFPVRTRCATLPWITLEAALENRQDAVVSGEA
jgi:nitrogen fixation NifU-like protein